MNFANVESHLNRIATTVYPEKPMEQHDHLTSLAVNYLIVPVRSAVKSVLDVGCGQGVALKHFADLGFDAVGISLSDEDIRECRGKGYSVAKQDMNFMDFEDESFDLIWCRHCIEHSPMPMITLLELERVAKEGGYCYLEVPQDDSVHIDNRNHYSVLSDRAWQSLLRRTDFNLLHRGQWVLQMHGWIDIYWYYFLQKKGN